MKHPKSYDSTPETRKRMSKVKLKGGKAETLLAKALWHQGYRYRKMIRSCPVLPTLQSSSIVSLFLSMASFGTEKIGKTGRHALRAIVSIESKKSKKTWLATFGMTNC